MEVDAETDPCGICPLIHNNRNGDGGRIIRPIQPHNSEAVNIYVIRKSLDNTDIPICCYGQVERIRNGIDVERQTFIGRRIQIDGWRIGKNPL